MRSSFVVLTVVGIALVALAAPLVAQDQEDVRGAFLTSRPKEKTEPTNATTKPNRRHPRSTGTTQKNSATTTPKAGNPQNTGAPASSLTAARIGLGLTLFMRDSSGLAVRTDPTHVFHQGDRVRILLESNTDGYLYIFNTTNDGPPVMIYPQAELDDAGNYLRAHVPFEIPSSLGAEERLRWLAFDENAGDERLFFVFTREQLAGVPIEDDLINFCKQGNPPCPFRPSAELWVKVQKQMSQPVKTDRTSRYGIAQSNAEHEATTRGLGLAQSDPEPAVILMTSSSSSTLVASLNLIHK